MSGQRRELPQKQHRGLDADFFNAPQSLSERSDGGGFGGRSGFSDTVVGVDGQRAPAKRLSSTLGRIGDAVGRKAPGKSKPKARKAKAKPAAKQATRTKELSSPKARGVEKPYKGYDAHEGKPVKKKDAVNCKQRPEDNTPKKSRRGGGGSRKFIPWCK